jgi:putative FmdB family regulatory protein
MPLYEYKCISCQKLVEKIQKFSDPEITTCPHCRGTLERVVSAPAIAFKGGGWYADGYASAKPAASSSSEASTSPAATAPSAPAAAPATTPAAAATSAPGK